MKNYVVWTNCQIQDPQREFGLEAPNYKNYDRMCEISLASARKFLGGAWQSKIFTDPAASRTAMFQQNWQRIWESALSTNFGRGRIFYYLFFGHFLESFFLNESCFCSLWQMAQIISIQFC